MAERKRGINPYTGEQIDAYPATANDFMLQSVGDRGLQSLVPAWAALIGATPAPVEPNQRARGYPPSAIDFLNGGLGSLPAATPYQPPATYPDIDRQMIPATRQERMMAGMPRENVPQAPTDVAQSIPGQTVPAEQTQDWPIPQRGQTVPPVGTDTNAYPLPPEGTVVGQDVTGTSQPATGFIGYPTADPSQLGPFNGRPEVPGSLPAAPVSTFPGRPEFPMEKQGFPAVATNEPPRQQYRFDLYGNPVPVNPDAPGVTGIMKDALTNWRDYMAKALDQSSTAKDEPKPDDKKPKEATPAVVNKPGNVTAGGVTVTPGGGVAVNTEAIGAQTQTGSGMKDIQTMIDALFPPLDQSNPKQDVADANAERQLQRDALLAQLTLGAGIAAGAGPQWAGIGRAGLAVAQVADDGFKRYQAALQDSADRYAEANRTSQAYDTAKRSAVVSLLGKDSETQREDRKLAFEMYKDRREQAMSLFKPWLSVLEKSDPLMGGPDLQSQQAAIANGINHYLATGEFVEPHWQTTAQ